MTSVNPYDKTSQLIRLFLNCDQKMERESGRCKIKTTVTEKINRKRSRAYCREEEVDGMIRQIITMMDKYSVFPTFKTMVDERFFHLLANNMNNHHFGQVSLFIQEFRTILKKAEIILQKNDDYEFYNIMTNDLINILINSQQVILLFNLSCNDQSEL